MIPTDEYNGEHCLALPKLNLQFLTFHDYLLRNYDLFRLESCYEIRSDLEDSIRRINARKVRIFLEFSIKLSLFSKILSISNHF